MKEEYENEKYSKDYFECYARITLETCFDSKLKALSHLDSPDFQSEELGIGLEVVEAISKKEGEQRRYVNEYFGKNHTPQYIKEQMESRNKKMKGSIEIFENMAIFDPYKGLYDTKIHHELIKAKIEDKSKKLNTIYYDHLKNHHKFKDHWLYVFAHTQLLEKHDIIEIVNSVELHENFNFNKIFIDCIGTLYIINDFRDIEILEVKGEDMKSIKKKAIDEGIKRGIDKRQKR